MSSPDLDALATIVPPPPTPLQVSELDEWSGVQAAIEISLPDELAAFSKRYGSGFFEHRDFQLRIFNVFGPLFIGRCIYRHAIRTDTGYQNSGDRWAAYLRNKFEFGATTWSHEDREHYLMWDTSNESSSNWPICVPTAGNLQQTFELGLIPFLVEVFSGNLKVDGFPSKFKGLQFVPEAEGIPGPQSE